MSDDKSDSFNTFANIIVKIIITLTLIAVLWLLIINYLKILDYNDSIHNNYLQLKQSLQIKVKLVKNLAKEARITKKKSLQLQNENINALSELNKNTELYREELIDILKKRSLDKKYKKALLEIERQNNRIDIESMHYNLSVKKLNTLLETFPANLIAIPLHISKQKYF